MAEVHEKWLSEVLGVDLATRRSAPARNAPARAARDSSARKVQLAKARQVWIATRAKIQNDIAKLQSSLAAAYEGHDLAQELQDAFNKRVEPVLANLDASLAHKLDELAATEGEQHAVLIKEARAIIASYERFLDSDDVIGHLDRNPLVPIAIRKTLDGSLEALNKVLA
jgi:hypothetical protein